jgi:hypothetical protein
MKRSLRVFALIAIIALPGLPGCKEKEVISAEKIQLTKLSAKTWQIHSLVVDGSDQTSLYPGLTLTFSKGIFVATNGKEIWPSNGT